MLIKVTGGYFFTQTQEIVVKENLDLPIPPPITECTYTYYTCTYQIDPRAKFWTHNSVYWIQAFDGGIEEMPQNDRTDPKMEVKLSKWDI